MKNPQPFDMGANGCNRSRDYSANPAELLLSRLDGVRSSGPDRWVAICPSHDDKSPSLSVRDAGDRVLVHCHAGCTFSAVIGALGIEARQLFVGGKAPRQIATANGERRLTLSQVREHLSFEFMVLGTYHGTALSALTPADHARAQLATDRVVKGLAALLAVRR